MRELDVIKARDLSQALKLLGQAPEETAVLAGGTDVVPGLHQGSKRFSGLKRLVDVHHLAELQHIEWNGEHLRIGAATVFSRLAEDPLIREKAPLLAQAASQIGSVQIRNRATLAGNFVNNAPCADSVPPLLIYDARVEIRSYQGQRTLALQDLLKGPYKTALNPGELVTAVILTPLDSAFRSVFYKLGRRRAVAISRITLSVALTVKDQTIDQIKVAAGAITPIGMRIPQIEKCAAGLPVHAEFLKKMSQRLGESILEITGLRWSTAYKLPVIQQNFYQLLWELALKAGEKKQ